MLPAPRARVVPSLALSNQGFTTGPYLGLLARARATTPGGPLPAVGLATTLLGVFEEQPSYRETVAP